MGQEEKNKGKLADRGEPCYLVSTGGKLIKKSIRPSGALCATRKMPPFCSCCLLLALMHGHLRSTYLIVWWSVRHDDAISATDIRTSSA